MSNFSNYRLLKIQQVIKHYTEKLNLINLVNKLCLLSKISFNCKGRFYRDKKNKQRSVCWLIPQIATTLELCPSEIRSFFLVSHMCAGFHPLLLSQTMHRNLTGEWDSWDMNQCQYRIQVFANNGLAQ